MKTLIAATLLALCHVGTASAAPDWCKDAQFDDDYDLKDLSSKDLDRVFSTFAKATCKPNAEAQASAAQINTARQAWGKKLGMQEADWAEAVAFANVKERPNTTITFSSKDLSQFTALDQYWAIYNSMSLPGGYTYDRRDYLADMFEPNLSEAGRLAYIEKCIDYPFATFNPAVVYALCQADIDAFNPAKFAQQVTADTKHPAEQKMALRIRAYGLPARVKEHKAAVEKIWAKDEGYKKLWDAAAKGRADFASRMGSRTDLLALATRMDSAFFLSSRKMVEGCEAPTQEALDKIIADKVPLALFKGVDKDIPKPYDPSKKDESSVGAKVGPSLVDIPEVAFIAGPYAQCHKEAPTTKYLNASLYYVPGYRGPRGAAFTSITKEKVVLDDMNATIDYPKANQPWLSRLYTTESAGGVVKSVREEGDILLVSLEKLTVKRQECVQSHRTNRISRINSDGSLSYELICDKMGTVTYDETPSDFRIEKKWKSHLKKGVVFSAVGERQLGALLAVWPSKDAKNPSVVFGQAVK
jgi:hypothetical protein